MFAPGLGCHMYEVMAGRRPEGMAAWVLSKGHVYAGARVRATQASPGWDHAIGGGLGGSKSQSPLLFFDGQLDSET